MPADVGLSARADSLGELFAALAEGLSDVICVRPQVRPARRWAVAAAAEDVEALAVDFLGAVLAAIQTDHFLVASAEVGKIDSGRVEAELIGEPYDPARHELKIEVKAVTYHLLRIAREAGQWVGRVVLDL